MTACAFQLSLPPVKGSSTRPSTGQCLPALLWETQQGDYIPLTNMPTGIYHLSHF